MDIIPSNNSVVPHAHSHSHSHSHSTSHSPSSPSEPEPTNPSNSSCSNNSNFSSTSSNSSSSSFTSPSTAIHSITTTSTSTSTTSSIAGKTMSKTCPATAASSNSSSSSSSSSPSSPPSSASSSKSSFLHMFAGSIAGISAKTILQPLDLVKVRLQVQDGTSANEYRGVYHAIRSIVSSDGVFGLYRGLTPNLMGSGVSWGCYFFTYAKSKDLWKKHIAPRTLTYDPNNPNNNKLGPIAHLSCAALAGMVGITVTNPITMVKTRLQLQGTGMELAGKPYKNTLDAFLRIAREEGILSFWRGLGPSLLLVSNGSLQFMAYEEMKKVASIMVGGDHRLTPDMFFLMGGAAKMFSTTITYPLSVTRSRLFQRASHSKDSSSEGKTRGVVVADRKYNGVVDVLKHIAKKEGARGFYKGFWAHILKTTPSSAITFTVYEVVIKFLLGSNAVVPKKTKNNDI